MSREAYVIFERDTKMTAYFRLCQRDEYARQEMNMQGYSEAPERIVWNNNTWKHRQLS